MRSLIVSMSMLVLLSACGEDGVPSQVAPEFTNYYQSFRDAGTARGVSTDTWVNLEFGNPYGVCNSSTSGIPTGSELVACCHGSTVTVDASWWARMSTVQRELLIFHELGHCILHREHRSDSERGLPESIMYPDTTDGYLPSAYTDFKSQYLDELFGKRAYIDFGF